MAADHRIAFVTGASSGIGEALAVALAARGYRVGLAARRVARLEALARRLGEGRTLVLPCDVTRDDSVEEAIARLLERWGRLDVAIANAGYGVKGSFTELTLDDYRRQLETNFFGLLRTTYACLGPLRESHGRLVLMGSIVGHLSPPGSSAYSASKFAVRGLAEGIRAELRKEGIALTLVSPGMLATEFPRVDNQGRLGERVRNTGPAWIRVPPERAARAMVRAIERGAPEVVVTLHGKALVLASRLAPRLLLAAMERLAPEQHA